MKRVLVAIAVLAAWPALAQDWPSLLGVWKGTTRTATVGAGGHFSDSQPDGVQFREVELTIEWTEENDGRYFGTISSANHRERKLGVLSGDGVSFFTVDEDGSSVGRLIDADHFELCYMQTSIADAQMVASCVTFERQ